MCIIIEREPNFTIPFEDFESAVHVNPDGYGIAIPDGKGKLVTLRSHEKPDPEELYQLLNEELIDKKLLIHLRYTTVGKTELRNSHPFPVLEHRTHGVDIRMAHNGTISKFKPIGTDRSSDTRHFVKEFVRPLFQRLIKGMSSEEIMSDPFVKRVLEDQIPSSSVLSFIDGFGNTMTIHETGNGGKREEGWYYSNKYSFNRTHREPKASNIYYPPTNYFSDTRLGDTHVFLWDELKDDTMLKLAVSGAQPKYVHGAAVTARKFLPLYNIGQGVYDFGSYMLDQNAEGILHLPEYAQGEYNNVMGKVIKLDGYDLFDLDLFYTGSGEFEQTTLAVRKNPLSKEYIQCITWVAKPEGLIDRAAQADGPNLREGLDFTPFSTITKEELYKY